MSISSEITSIGENLKADYTALETLGVSVEDRNIENIKDMANQIYAKFPKTDYEEGSNITLSNTLKGKLDFEDGIVGYGQTEQDSTKGYNIIDTSNFATTTINGVTCTNNGDGTFTINGTANATTQFNLINGNNVVNWSAGTYKLLGQPSGDSGWDKFIMFFNNWDGVNCYSGETKTLSNSTTSLTLTIRIGSGKTYNNLTFFPMITTNTSLTNADCEKFTGNSPSPSPSYPQDIEVVRGKNRFNKDNFESYNGFVDITTKKVNYNASVKSIIIGCESNTTYTVQKLNGGNYDRFSISSFTSKPTVNSVATNVIGDNSAKSLTITSGTSDKFLMILYYNTNETTYTESQILDSIMLEKGSQATSYLPYNTLEVKIQNKNLCTEMEQGDVSTSTGEASSYQPTTSGFIRSKDYIPVKPSEVITVSYKNTATSSIQIVIFEYNANKTYIGFYYSNASTYTRTLGNETAYIKIRLQDTTNTLSNNTEIQVEYGNTKTSYVEHQEQTQTISLGEYEFAKIGNYVDTIEYDVDEDKVYKNEKIGKVVFTGASSESWNFVSVSESKKRNYIAVDDIITSIQDSETSPIKCNYFIDGSYSDGASPSGSINIITGRSGIAQINIFHNIADSNANFKTWLSTHNTEVRYVKAQATEIEITDTTLINQVKALYNAHSNNGTTIITSNGNLPMIIKVRALKGE